MTVGRIKGQRWDLPIDRGHNPSGGVSEQQQLVTAHRLRDAAEALGAARTGLLMWTVIDEVPWERLAGKLGLIARIVKARAAETLSDLAAWRAGQPVLPPLKTRFRIQPSS